MLTPAALVTQLALVDRYLTPRATTDWIRRGLLPPLQQVGRGEGGGKGPLFRWSDPDVLLQAFTIDAAMTVRSRASSATLMTWFSGFEYPLVSIREAWLQAEHSSWLRTLEFAVEGPFDPLDPDELRGVLEALPATIQKSRYGKKMGRRATEFYLRVLMDPDFDVEAMPAEQIVRLLASWPGMSAAPGLIAVIELLDPDTIKSAVLACRSALSPATLPDLIRGASDGALAAAHRDLRVATSLYRSELRRAIEGVVGGTSDLSDLRLTFMPQVTWRLGRLLLRVDLALRKSGHEARVDRTSELLAELGGLPETRSALEIARSEYPATRSQLDSSGRSAVSADLRQRLEAREGGSGLTGRPSELVGAIWAIWEPLVAPLLERLMDADSRPT